MRRRPLLLVPALACAMTVWARPLAADPVAVGWIERVWLGDEGVVVTAKLDTGADNSSLHATDIRWIARADGNWVVFDVTAEDGRKTRFERKVTRIASIRRAGGAMQKRPVVRMEVCLAGVHRLIEVNLTDRSGLNYEFLVGRSFLAGYFLVDSARQNTVEPKCARARAP
jgi:hypothetical protein